MTTKKVYGAIAAIAGELAITGIQKDRKNEQQGYKFRGIDEIYNHLAPLLSTHGLCILPQVENREVVERTNSKGNALFYVTVRVRFAFVSKEDGSTHEVVTYGEAMDSGDKATNKAMSAAYKYACLQTFCIPTEGDNDADGSTHEVQGKGEEPIPSAFNTPDARLIFVANVLSSYENAGSEAELAEIAALNKPTTDKIKECAKAGNQEDVKAVNDMARAYREKLDLLKLSAQSSAILNGGAAHA